MIHHSLQNWTLKGKSLLPIVQGGMGVGISAHRLAGTVAAEGGMGTIASVDLRHLHPDLLAAVEGSTKQSELERVNLIALDREIKAAKSLAQGNGLIAVNIMKAVDAYAKLVRQACESGADAIVMGAGLPLDLPELTADYPDVALIPILSDSRGVAIILKKWQKKGRLPDAIIIEHPRYAGGHLGAAKVEDLTEPRFEFSQVLREVQIIFEEMGLSRQAIPIIVAGGIYQPEQIIEYQRLGAAAVQMGTAFAVTQEGDASEQFKQTLAHAKPEEIVEFISVAGLPARAVLTPWLKSYLARLDKLQANAKADLKRCTQGLNCLSTCGLRDGIGKIGQFCIDLKLAAAWRGETRKGLFFRGAAPLPFGENIRPVHELLQYMLTGKVNAIAVAS